MALLYICRVFPGGSVVKNPPANAGDMGYIPHSGRSPGEGNGNPFPVFLPGKSMDRGAWWAAVHGVTKSQTRLSDFTFPFHFHALEKEMATHSSVLAWRVPGTGSLVGCQLWGRTESDTTERLHFHFSLSCIGEGNGNPLQCSCLENPRDGGAWWVAISGVAQSRTRLKRLSSSSKASFLHTFLIDFTYLDFQMKGKISTQSKVKFKS